VKADRRVTATVAVLALAAIGLTLGLRERERAWMRDPRTPVAATYQPVARVGCPNGIQVEQGVHEARFPDLQKWRSSGGRGI
jgi:hypothetical protein